jgi:hypothetical protein
MYILQHCMQICIANHVHHLHMVTKIMGIMIYLQDDLNVNLGKVGYIFEF